MLLLLDTHALIWLDQDHPSLGPEARASAAFTTSQPDVNLAVPVGLNWNEHSFLSAVTTTGMVS